MPWLGDPVNAVPGIHAIGTIADRPNPSLGSQSGADGAVAHTSTAFTAASGQFTTNDTGMTLKLQDSATNTVEQYTVTYVSATALTLSAAWPATISGTPTATTVLSWVLSGREPSNAGLLYHATDGTDTATGTTYESDGTQWVPVSSSGGAGPARIAWVYGTVDNYQVSTTIGGAGYGGTDWVPLPTYWVPSTGEGVGDTNAFNKDPNHGHHVNDTSGDLYDAGFFIFSTHYPLVDYGFSSGDKVSSIRIYNNWNGFDGGVYKCTLKIGVNSNNGTTTAPAEQTFGVLLVAFATDASTNWAGEAWGGQSGTRLFSGQSLQAAPASLTDLITVVGGAANPNFEMTGWTDPGSPEWNISQTITLRIDSLLSVATDGGGTELYTDIVIFGCNPGPKDQFVDIGLFVENENQSEAFAE